MALGFMDQSASNIWRASMVRKMRKEFAKIKGIGSIMFRTIYGFYDEPLLFSCESLTGAVFLLLRLQGEDGRWLMAGLSEARLGALENNEIEIRMPYVNPESGYLYLLHDEGEGMKYDILEPDLLIEDMLPYPGEYLDYQKDEVREYPERDIIGEEDEKDYLEHMIKLFSDLSPEGQKFIKITLSALWKNEQAEGKLQSQIQ